MSSNTNVELVGAVSDGKGVIQPMPAESVQRIVAGQAISDLASCVKELVDNALDAGSKSVNSTYFYRYFQYHVEATHAHAHASVLDSNAMPLHLRRFNPVATHLTQAFFEIILLIAFLSPNANQFDFLTRASTSSKSLTTAKASPRRLD